jgi:exonuclease III
LRRFVDEYAPDVLLLQEIKISEDLLGESGVREEFSEFEQFYSFARKAGYAGSAVWVRRGVFSSGLSQVADVVGVGVGGD